MVSSKLNRQLTSESPDSHTWPFSSTYTIMRTPSASLCGQLNFSGLLFVCFAFLRMASNTEQRTGIYNDSHQNKTNNCHSKIPTSYLGAGYWIFNTKLFQPLVCTLTPFHILYSILCPLLIISPPRSCALFLFKFCWKHKCLLYKINKIII